MSRIRDRSASSWAERVELARDGVAALDPLVTRGGGRGLVTVVGVAVLAE